MGAWSLVGQGVSSKGNCWRMAIWVGLIGTQQRAGEQPLQSQVDWRLSCVFTTSPGCYCRHPYAAFPSGILSMLSKRVVTRRHFSPVSAALAAGGASAAHACAGWAGADLALLPAG